MPKYSPCSSTLFTALIFIGAFLFAALPRANAASINASGLLGQPQGGTPNYALSGIDNDQINGRSFQYPAGAVLDRVNHRLFVDDSQNNRVLVYQLDPTDSLTSLTAAYVLGQPSFTANSAATTQNGMSFPFGGSAFDPVNNRLFVAEQTNNRVLVFDVDPSRITNGENAIYVLGQQNFTSSVATTTQNGLNVPTSVAYDATSTRLFVSDYRNSRIMVFNVATSSISNGENASYVLGQTDYITATAARTQSNISHPTNIAYDYTDARLFVADYFNNRILVFNVATSSISNGENAANVLGPSDFTTNAGNTATQHNVAPVGLAFDPGAERLFASNYGNNRIMVFNVATSTISNGENAVNVLGQTSFTVGAATTTQGGLNDPEGNLAYDPSMGILFAPDSSNNRIMIFAAGTSTIANGESATSEIGQYDQKSNPTFTSSLANVSNITQGLNSPYYSDLDYAGHRLFVSDYGNNRVLVYQLDSSNNITSQIPAYVLGQSSLTTFNSAASQSGLKGPGGVAFDSNNNRLFVADSNNNRIMVFNVATSTISNGENASNVLGQTNFSNASSATTQNGMNQPWVMAYDPVTNRLFEAEYNNARVLVFDAATSTITNGENAESVIGQASYTANIGATTQSGLKTGNEGLVYDPVSKRLFVGDKVNARVLVFDAATSTLAANPVGENAQYIIGQPDFTTANSVTTQSGFQFSTAIAYDPSTYTMYVSDYHNQRVMLFNVATSSISNGENAENVIGQNDYVSNGLSVAQNTVGDPYGVTYDYLNRHLFVVDQIDNRVMEFSFIAITTPSLSNGTAGSSYSAAVDTTSSQGTPSFSLISGLLPAGLSLAPSTGIISGNPTSAGTASFTIEADDNFATGSFVARAAYSITIATAPASRGGGGSSITRTPSAVQQGTATSTLTVSAPSVASTTVVVSFTRNLFIGLSGTDVVLLQTLLKQWGYYVYPEITGYFGSVTTSAVVAFQKAYGIEPTGRLGPATRAKILALVDPKSAAPLTISPTPTAFTRDLHVGSTGDDVRGLQQYLNTHGAVVATDGSGSAGKETTYFGAATRAALAQFQAAAGIIPAAGYFGTLTRGYLAAHS